MVAQQDLLTMAKGVAIAAQQFIAAGQCTDSTLLFPPSPLPPCVYFCVSL
jgi:hypothetical protein